MPPPIYAPEAEDDVAEAHADHEARQPGLGDRLVREVGRAVGSLEVMPMLFGEVSPGVRACPVRGFKFVIYYQVAPDGTVRVAAVRHGSEDPAVWQGRVRP